MRKPIGWSWVTDFGLREVRTDRMSEETKNRLHAVPVYLESPLWDRLKAELEEEAQGKNLTGTEQGFKETPESLRAAEFLERMRRMEDRS